MGREDEYGQSFDNVVRSVFVSTWKIGPVSEIAEIISSTSFSAKEVLADITCFPVNSSHLTYIGYSPHFKVLEIRFKNSDYAFRYRDVSQEFWNDFVSAGSFGSYFHKYIKDSHFDWIKLDAKLKKVTTNEL